MTPDTPRPIARSEGFGTVVRLFRKGETVVLTGNDGVVVGEITVKSTMTRGARLAITMRRNVRIARREPECGTEPRKEPDHG